MPSPPQIMRQIPVVALLCVLVFSLYGVSPGEAISVRCRLPHSSTLSSAPHCQVEQGRKLGWLPKRATEFDWLDMTLTSHLCDKTPRGGVRFCHQLTLVGERRRITLPEWRSPLTAEVIDRELNQFVTGKSQTTLAWSTPPSPLETCQTLALAVLLSMTAWGWGAWRWPRAKPLPLDGLDDLSLPPKA